MPRSKRKKQEFCGGLEFPRTNWRSSRLVRVLYPLSASHCIWARNHSVVIWIVAPPLYSASWYSSAGIRLAGIVSVEFVWGVALISMLDLFCLLICLDLLLTLAPFSRLPDYFLPPQCANPHN